MYAPLLSAILATIQPVLVDELEPVYPDRPPLAMASGRLDVARGGTAGVHVVIDGLAQDEPIEFRAIGQGLAQPNWYRLIDVPVEENTGPDSRTERWDKAQNQHVIRDAPFRVYEVLEPVTSGLVAPGDRLALHVQWVLASDAQPGLRPVRIEVSQGDAHVNLPLDVMVHDVEVPAAGRDTLGYTNWFSPSQMAKAHELEPWSEAHWSMMRRYGDLMARGRQSMFWVRWSDFFSLQDGQWVLDDHRLRRYVDVFTDAGLYWIEGAPIAGRPDGDWSSPVLKLKLGGELLTSEAGRTLFAAQAQQIRDQIEANGWQERWVQHIADEPTDVNANDYVLAADLMRSSLPGVPIFEATMTKSLAGAIDMWCPQVQAWQAEREFFDDRRDAGDKVWVYTCLRPGGAWLNRLLDQERLRQVYFGWGAAKEGWDGYLHWGLNHWKADPFMYSVVDHPAMPGTDNRLPAGDTHVVYPGKDGPLSGLRFEAHRIGLEDHTLLAMLANEPKRALLDRVYRGADDWEPDVARYREARRHLLEQATAVPSVVVLGFPGCPMTPTLTSHVREAVHAMAPHIAVQSVDLSSLPDDDPRLCWPAPSVLVDGVDLFGVKPSPEPTLACRVYPGGLPDASGVATAMRVRFGGQN